MKRALGIYTVIMAMGLVVILGQERRQKASFVNGVLTVGDVRLEFVKVPAGKFRMGSESRYPNEQPLHDVKLDGFYISRTEVTQGLWQALMTGNPAHFQGGRDYPVEKVSWNDCQEFISQLNQACGGGFRLPTEAEWEYACRAGSSAGRPDGLDGIAWYRDNSGSRTHAVAGKKPNVWGLHDMLGNVLEWCQDWYEDHYYRTSPTSNPQGPPSGSYRVVRGSGWRSSAEGVCCTIRINSDPRYNFNTIGLRLVRDIQGQ